MSRATDPIEGYYAQQTDTSTRDLFDKDKGLTPTPTARELLTLLGMEDTVETLAARVEAVLALHRQGALGNACRHCVCTWPCPTVRALDGQP
jgi:hypothetical protein